MSATQTQKEEDHACDVVSYFQEVVLIAIYSNQTNASSCEFHEFGSGDPGPGSQRPGTEGFEAVTCLTPE